MTVTVAVGIGASGAPEGTGVVTDAVACAEAEGTAGATGVALTDTCGTSSICAPAGISAGALNDGFAPAITTVAVYGVCARAEVSPERLIVTSWVVSPPAPPVPVSVAVGDAPPVGVPVSALGEAPVPGVVGVPAPPPVPVPPAVQV
nr:MAG: hypothetical protein DIU60_02645 [Actinomycetota bacterium]